MKWMRKNLKTDDKILFRGIFQINQPRLFLTFAIGYDGNYTNKALPSKDLQMNRIVLILSLGH